MTGPKTLIEPYVTARTLDAELERWMAEVQPCQWRPVRPLKAREVALLVVDMNRPFVEKRGPLSSPAARAVLPRIAATVAAFRQAKRPVLWIVQGHHSVRHDRGDHLSSWWPTPILEKTDDVRMASGLKVADGEKTIMKRRYSGFYQSDLELTLRCLKVSQVVIGGVLTNVCPFLTAFDAFFRDLEVYYLADGTASLRRSMHISALQTIAGWCGHVVRTREVCAWLKRPRSR